MKGAVAAAVPYLQYSGRKYDSLSTDCLEGSKLSGQVIWLTVPDNSSGGKVRSSGHVQGTSSES